MTTCPLPDQSIGTRSKLPASRATFSSHWRPMHFHFLAFWVNPVLLAELGRFRRMDRHPDARNRRPGRHSQGLSHSLGGWSGNHHFRVVTGRRSVGGRGRQNFLHGVSAVRVAAGVDFPERFDADGHQDPRFLTSLPTSLFRQLSTWDTATGKLRNQEHWKGSTRLSTRVQAPKPFQVLAVLQKTATTVAPPLPRCTSRHRADQAAGDGLTACISPLKVHA
jgi:hypothetical protein